MTKAEEFGGGDQLFTSTSDSMASLFAKANPAEGDPALLRITVPNSTINSLSSSNLLSVDQTPLGDVYRFQPEGLDILNDNAIIDLLPVP